MGDGVHMLQAVVYDLNTLQGISMLSLFDVSLACAPDQSVS
jgi:hypothetical protein